VTPTPFDGVLYVFAPGRVYGLDAADGRRLWDRTVYSKDSKAATLPLVVDAEHFVVAGRYAVVFYDRTTGESTFRHPHTATTGLVFSDELVYVVSPRFAAAIDPASSPPWWEGTRPYRDWLWAVGAASQPQPPEFAWISRVRPSDVRLASVAMFRPAFDGQSLVTSNANGLLRAFDAATGELSWETELASLHGPPTFTADGLLVPLRDGVGLLDPASGEWLREQPLDVLALQVKRWVVVLEQGTFVVDGPGKVLALR